MARSNTLLAGTVVPVVIGLAVAAGSGQASASASGGETPSATPGHEDAGALRLASCNPCRPCAAACGPCNPCSPCNPCAAACEPCGPCGPCSPCGACSPCNPCAAANPCSPCGPCNPCNPCNPCAGACGPCGACNPCNPCAAGATAASSDCVIPRLAAACSPCNPCAAANPCNPCGPCNPCNPCAAANPCSPCGPCNPCNPCAAANPCNPCGPCNPCNPCAAAEEVELTAAEAREAYACISAVMAEGYAKSGNQWAASYRNWRNVAAQPYVSDTHGARYVNNYANDIGAENYALFEEAGPAPVGSVYAKDSFTVTGKGGVGAGPLFLMEKMEAGFDPDTGDWRYTLIMPTGRVIGTTGGEGAAKVGFCADCHLGVEDQDSRFFLDEEYRVQ